MWTWRPSWLEQLSHSNPLENICHAFKHVNKNIRSVHNHYNIAFKPCPAVLLRNGPQKEAPRCDVKCCRLVAAKAATVSCRTHLNPKNVNWQKEMRQTGSVVWLITALAAANQLGRQPCPLAAANVDVLKMINAMEMDGWRIFQWDGYICEYEPCKSCIGISGLVGPVPKWPDPSLQSVDSVEGGM